MRRTTLNISWAALCAAFVFCVAAGAHAAVDVAVVGDCEKLVADAPLPASDYMWDADTRTITLHAAKNEVVAFQVVVRSDAPATGGDVRFGDLAGPAAFAASNFTGFLELYQRVTRGVNAPGDLPIDLDYPDALVPLYDPYAEAGRRAPVAAGFDVKPGRNTIVWVDCFVPPDTPAGTYKGALTVVAGGAETPVNVELTVWDFALPADSHVFSYTLIFRWEFEYHEKAEYGFNKSGWEKMKRYESMFLQHRLQNYMTRLWPDMTFNDDGTLKTIDWTEYDKYAGPRLDGTFVKEGPAKGARPSLWFFQFGPLFPNDPDITGPAVDFAKRGPYEENVLRTLAREVARHWREKGWTTPVQVDVLDESNDWQTIQWAARIFHEEGRGLFLYMNTGHYRTQPALVGSVDIWSPNAENYDPEELALRIAAGDMTWFYHWWEPYMGHMVINAPGVSMRVWDNAAAKYGVDGTFLWVANNWPHPKNWRAQWGEMPSSPYVVAAGANGGERYGNGTYVYPGAELPDVGLPAIEGPVPSMRLKTMRRGAEDYEYMWLLAREGRVWDARAKKIQSTVLRSALVASSQLGQTPTFEVDPALPWTSDITKGEGDWSHNAADWHAMRLRLAEALLEARRENARAK